MLDAWRRWFHEAEDACRRETDRLAGMWISEHVMSEGVREQIERTRQAHQRWEERLTALNAYMDAR
jgi:hypothetical protein